MCKRGESNHCKCEKFTESCHLPSKIRANIKNPKYCVSVWQSVFSPLYNTCLLLTLIAAQGLMIILFYSMNAQHTGSACDDCGVWPEQRFQIDISGLTQVAFYKIISRRTIVLCWVSQLGSGGHRYFSITRKKV